MFKTEIAMTTPFEQVHARVAVQAIQESDTDDRFQP